MTSRWPIWLWDFSYCRFNVIALWTCERMRFIAGLFGLEAKEPRLRLAFGAVGPFNEIGMQCARLICSHSNSLTGGSALASLSHRRLAPNRADDGIFIKSGIDAPERLLSMDPDQIRLLQGMGPVLMKEVERYRRKFK